MIEHRLSRLHLTLLGIYLGSAMVRATIHEQFDVSLGLILLDDTRNKIEYNNPLHFRTKESDAVGDFMLIDAEIYVGEVSV